MSTFLHFPGLIDCHVHFREPGFPEKADMESEGNAAAAAGVMTVCEMPNTNPPAVTVEAFADKVERAKRVTDCDLRFFFGITESAHLEEFRALQTAPENEALKQRCCGVKLYLDHSTGDQKVEGGIVEEIFKTCAELDVQLVAHCEDAEMNEAAANAVAENHDSPLRKDVYLHSESRPPESEAKSIEFAIGLAKKHGTAFHVAHLSTSFGMDLVRQAKADGYNITCEVCPHHLFLSTDDYEQLGTLGKMNPPLRPPEHLPVLWEGIADGTVDCISTDHAPHTLGEKQSPENPLEAPSGVPGVETMLPLLLTVAAGQWPHPNPAIDVARCTLHVDDIKRLCFDNPNRIFRLNAPSESRITIDPEAEWVIQADDLRSRCRWTPFEGWRVKGKIVEV